MAKNVVDTLISNIAEQIESRALTNSKVGHLTAGVETLSPDMVEVVSNDGAKLADIIDETQVLLTNDDMELTVGQIAVGQETAKLALDLNVAYTASKNIIAADSTAIVVEPYGHATTDNVPVNTIAMEAWDGQDVSNVAASNIAVNIMASKQSPIGELFFPTVVVPTRQLGVSITVNVDSIQKPVTRKITGTPDKFEKVSLIKATNDFTNFSVDKTKLIPVLRTGQNDDKLLDTVQYVDKSTGDAITTAPIRVDKEVSLLGISQTDEQIAKGVMNETDALDGTIHTKRIYYTIGNDEFFFRVGDGKWTHTLTGHNKDLEFTYDNDAFIINTSNTKKADGTASGVLAALPANHQVRVRVKLNGSGNTETATMMINTNVIENPVIEIRNGAGDILPITDENYATIKAEIEKIKITGYVLDAYTTNSNQREAGQIIVRDKYTYVYGLNFRSPVTIKMPANDIMGTDNSNELILSQVATLGIRTAASAIMALNEHAAYLKEQVGVKLDYSVDNRMGVSGRLINTYYNEPSIDLKAVVDSLKSNDRHLDIKSAIHDLIWDELSAMTLNSNYKTVIGLQNGGVIGKIDIMLAVPTRLYKYVKDLDFGSEYNVKVATAMYKGENDILNDRIFMSLGYGSHNGIAANPMRFGCMGWSPEYTTDVTVKVNNSLERFKTITPRFGHFALLNVLSVFKVSNLDDVLTKVTVNTKEQ